MSQPTNGNTGRESGFGFRTAAVLLATGGSTALFLQAITLVLAPLTGSGAGDRAALIALALVWIGIGMVLAGPFQLPPPPAYLGALEILQAIWAAALVLLVPAALPLLAGIGPTGGSAALLRWGLAGLLLFPFGILAGLAQAAAVYRLAGRPDTERMIDSTGAVLLAGGAGGLAAGDPRRGRLVALG